MSDYRERAITAMLDQVGQPYVWGTADCSARISRALVAAGCRPAGWRGTTRSMWLHLVRIPQVAVHPGDLVVYGSTTPVHVGMVLAGGEAVSARGGGAWCRTEWIARRAGARVRVHPLAYRAVLGYLRLPEPLPADAAAHERELRVEGAAEKGR